MKRSLSLVLATIICSWLFMKCDCRHLCTNAIPEINFVNFDSVDLHRVVLYEYAQDAKFDKLQDSILYSSDAIPGAGIRQIGSSIVVGGSNDYIVFVAALNRSWTIRISLDHNGSKQTSTCTSDMNYWLNDSGKYVPVNTTASNLPGPINIIK